jgi:hypothetical protein
VWRRAEAIHAQGALQDMRSGAKPSAMTAPPEVRDSFAGMRAAAAGQPFCQDASAAWKKGYLGFFHGSAKREAAAVAAGLTPDERDHRWGKIAAQLGQPLRQNASAAWKAGYAGGSQTNSRVRAHVRSAEEAAAAAAHAEMQRTGRDSSGAPLDTGVAGRNAYRRAIAAGLSEEEADVAAYEALWRTKPPGLGQRPRPAGQAGRPIHQ